jgi:hypothetical protein
MALGMLVVLSIVVGALAYYTVANQHTAARGGAVQRALGLAEEGLSDGLAVLASGTNSTNANALPLTTVTTSEGTITYVGSLSNSIWTVTATGTVKNPAVAGGTITRTVSQQAKLTQSIGAAWSYLYNGDTTQCMTIAHDSYVAASLYVQGSLCLANNAAITTSTDADVWVQVGGGVTLNNGAHIGTLAAPISAAKIAAGCGADAHVCGSSDRVYATTTSKTVDPATKPTADFSGWYQKASPGPKNACTVGSVPGGFDNDTTMNASRSTFDLTPASSYACQVKDGSGAITGELSWNATTKILTIAGTIFIDGNAVSSSKTAGTRYQGRATLYVNGTFTMNAGTILCGVSACDASWNTTANALIVVAGQKDATGLSASINNATFQGGIWAAGDYKLSNNGQSWGPVIAEKLTISNNNHLIPLLSPPPGAPGLTTTFKVVPGTWSG